MQSPLFRVATALLIGAFSSFLAAQTSLTTKNWQRVSAMARNQGIPVVMVVTGEGCGHCELMEREFLADPAIQSFLDGRSLVHAYHEDTGGKITDFDGESVRARMFMSRYKIFATPTLLFLDPDGRSIAPSLVGYNNPENFRDLVTGRLDEAQLALEAGNGASATALAKVPR